MTRHEVEALLFRINAVYPTTVRMSPVEHQARIEEWLDSTAGELPYELASEAFRSWKDNHDWPPSPHQFVELARTLQRAEARAALEAPVEEPACEPAVALAHARELRKTLAQLRRVPDDEVATIAHRSGALLHRGVSS